MSPVWPGLRVLRGPLQNKDHTAARCRGSGGGWGRGWHCQAERKRAPSACPPTLAGRGTLQSGLDGAAVGPAPLRSPFLTSCCRNVPASAGWGLGAWVLRGLRGAGGARAVEEGGGRV